MTNVDTMTNDIRDAVEKVIAPIIKSFALKSYIVSLSMIAPYEIMDVK